MRTSALAVGLAMIITACAARAVPPPTAPAAANKYPDFMYPVVPAAMLREAAAERVDLAWRFLQSGDTRTAARDFDAVVRRTPDFYPARAGEGYVALARGDHDHALTAFDTALRTAPQYVPALVGKGQTLLAMNRDADAVTAFEAALAADGSLVDVRRRVDVLRFRVVEQVIDAARSAASSGRVEQAQTEYLRAIQLSPDSAFLYRELAGVERRQGSTDRAVEHYTRAIELDASDSAALVAMADLLAERQDYAAADAAYRKAVAIEPTPELSAKIAALAERVRESRFPEEFKDIVSAPEVTRGDLAALIGLRLERPLAAAPQQQVVITDTAGHWADTYITQVARSGVMDPFENHTFQPRLAMRRGDVATAVRRLVAMAAPTNPALRKRLAQQPKIADMAPTHLVYPAAADAVASGVMPLLAGDRFEVNRPVTGAEAVDVVNRLAQLFR